MNDELLPGQWRLRVHSFGGSAVVGSFDKDVDVPTQTGLRRRVGGGARCTMRGNYHGLPAAASVEQAIVLAQLLIVRDLERRTTAIPENTDYVDILRRNEGSRD